jgi:hypothetical protein
MKKNSPFWELNMLGSDCKKAKENVFLLPQNNKRALKNIFIGVANESIQ